MILMQCERDPRIQILGSLCLRDILCGMKRFVTADPHFLHKLVSELRGFDTPQAHDAHYIEVFNSHVGPDDQTWFLGDITLKPLEHAAHLIQALNGRKHLVLGNHDYAHPMSKRHSTKHFRQAVDLFDTVYQTGMWKGMEVPVLMSHFPYQGDHSREDRFNVWRMPDRGAFLLHGHTHHTEKVEEPNSMHVGWDAWERPVSEAEVASYVSAWVKKNRIKPEPKRKRQR